MTQEHPITPPEELVEQWCHKWSIANGDFGPYLATQAALWGCEQRGAVNEAELQKARDEELEACCEWMRQSYQDGFTADLLRSARRPKTLKERGREALQNIHSAVVMETGGRELDVLKEIVESLPD